MLPELQPKETERHVISHISLLLVAHQVCSVLYRGSRSVVARAQNKQGRVVCVKAYVRSVLSPDSVTKARVP